LSSYGVKVITLLKSKEVYHNYDITMDKDSQKTRTTMSIAIIAIVAALALLGVVVITIITIPVQEAEAGCERRGPGFTVALNASKGKCFDRGTF
jgi:hypothetical protein